MSTQTDAPWYAKYQVSVPEGASGDWRVERFEVSKHEAEITNLRGMFAGGPHRGWGIYPGTYTRLTHRGEVIMSDTPAEIREHKEMMRRARGRILINGLGLGMVLQYCLAKRDMGGPFLVDHATVIEASPDVIALVAPHYLAMFGPDRLQIIQADAFEWEPPAGVRYQAVWNDIWSTICADNLPEYTRLARKYGRRCDWQGSWMGDELRAEQRRERRNRY